MVKIVPLSFISTAISKRYALRPKAFSPTVVSADSSALTKDEHPKNALLPIEVVVFGITTSSIEPSSKNALSHIDTKPSLKVISFKLVQPLKAYIPMLFTEAGISTEVKALPP